MDTKCLACARKARVLYVLAAVLIILNALMDIASAADNPKELVFLNWSDYMDPELICVNMAATPSRAFSSAARSPRKKLNGCCSNRSCWPDKPPKAYCAGRHG